MKIKQLTNELQASSGLYTVKRMKIWFEKPMQDAPRSKDRGNKSLQEAENEEQNARITTYKHQNAIFIFRT